MKRIDNEEKDLFENHIQKTQQFEKLFKKSFILQQIDEDDIDIQKKEEKLGLQELKRQLRIQQQHQQNKQQPIYSLRFWQTIIVQNIDLFSSLFLELNGLLILYPFNTIKTRIQSKHKTQDIAYFLRNKVANQPIYSGLGYGLLSNVIQNVMTFSLTQMIQIKLDEKYKNLSEIQKRIIAFMIADSISTPMRMTIETHKQLIQINSSDVSFKNILKKSRMAFMPTLLREISFRLTFLSAFNYLLNNNMIIQEKKTFNKRYDSLTIATLLGLILSNPFDVIATKITTQQIPKYSGLINCFQQVYMEEGISKLMFSGLWPRTVQLMINGTIFFHFYDSFRTNSLEAFQLQ